MHWSQLVVGRDGRPMSAGRRRARIVFVSDDEDEAEASKEKKLQDIKDRDVRYGMQLLEQVNNIVCTQVLKEAMKSVLRAVRGACEGGHRVDAVCQGITHGSGLHSACVCLEKTTRG